MANIDFFKNPDSYEVYVTVKFGTWKVAEIKRSLPLQTFFTAIS